MRLSESRLKRIIKEELAKAQRSKRPINESWIDWRLRIIDAVDMGLLSWEVVARECLVAMSQGEVRDIASVFELDNEESDW